MPWITKNLAFVRKKRGRRKAQRNSVRCLAPQQRKRLRGAGIVCDWQKTVWVRRLAWLSAGSLSGRRVVHGNGAPPCGQLPGQARQAASALGLRALSKKQAGLLVWSKRQGSGVCLPCPGAFIAPETIAFSAQPACSRVIFYCEFLPLTRFKPSLPCLP